MKASYALSVGILARLKFAHGERSRLGGIVLHASYHCSRYNMNTGRLTQEAFQAIFAGIREELDALT